MFVMLLFEIECHQFWIPIYYMHNAKYMDVTKSRENEIGSGMDNGKSLT